MHLPKELWAEIFSYICWPGRFTLSDVCTTWRSVILTYCRDLGVLDTSKYYRVGKFRDQNILDLLRCLTVDQGKHVRGLIVDFTGFQHLITWRQLLAGLRLILNSHHVRSFEMFHVTYDGSSRLFLQMAINLVASRALNLKSLTLHLTRPPVGCIDLAQLALTSTLSVSNVVCSNCNNIKLSVLSILPHSNDDTRQQMAYNALDIFHLIQTPSSQLRCLILEKVVVIPKYSERSDVTAFDYVKFIHLQVLSLRNVELYLEIDLTESIQLEKLVISDLSEISFVPFAYGKLPSLRELTMNKECINGFPSIECIVTTSLLKRLVKLDVQLNSADATFFHLFGYLHSCADELKFIRIRFVYSTECYFAEFGHIFSSFCDNAKQLEELYLPNCTLEKNSLIEGFRLSNSLRIIELYQFCNEKCSSEELYSFLEHHLDLTRDVQIKFVSDNLPNMSFAASAST